MRIGLAIAIFSNLDEAFDFLFVNFPLGTTSVIKQPSIAAGGGHVLGSSSSSSSSSFDLTGDTASSTPSESVRNVWANKFTDSKKPDDEESKPDDDLPKNNYKTKVTESSSAWEEIDDDILIHSVQNAIIEIADDGSNDSQSSRNSQNNVEPVMQHSTNETKPKISIKRELLDDLGLEDDHVEMIDDEFDDTLNER